MIVREDARRAAAQLDDEVLRAAWERQTRIYDEDLLTEVLSCHDGIDEAAFREDGLFDVTLDRALELAGPDMARRSVAAIAVRDVLKDALTFIAADAMEGAGEYAWYQGFSRLTTYSAVRSALIEEFGGTYPFAPERVRRVLLGEAVKGWEMVNRCTPGAREIAVRILAADGSYGTDGDTRLTPGWTAWHAVERAYADAEKELAPEKVWYFTFGSDEGFPFRDGYLIVRAATERAAVQKFRARHPDRPNGCVNCSFWYSAERWTDQYHGQEPFEVIE